MSKYIKKRLADIKREIGSLLDSLGVELTVTNVKDAIRVGTAPKAGNACFSPVTIVFGDSNVTYLDEARWEDAHIEVDLFSRRTLGDTGWVSWKHEDTHRYPITPPGKETFDWLRELIERAGVVPDGAGAPNCIENSSVGDVYRVLSRFFDNIEIDQDLTGAHGDVVETISFADGVGHEVEIPMHAGEVHATFYVDGEDFATFEQEDTTTIRTILYHLKRAPVPSRSATP